METALSIRNFFYIIDESMIRRSSHHFHHYLRQKNITIGILATRACEFATQDLLDIFRSSGHRCPKLGSKKSTKTVEKPPHKSGRKGTTTTTTTDAPAGRHLQVKWGADRTNWLLDWLNQNPEDRNRLFSASAAVAKEEGQTKITAKGTKNRCYAATAKAISDCAERTSRVLHPMSTVARNRTYAYKTIGEKMSSLAQSLPSKKSSPTTP